jgi:hypothetical protein
MKLWIFALSLLSSSAFALTKGEALCIETGMRVAKQTFYSAKSSCAGIPEGVGYQLTTTNPHAQNPPSTEGLCMRQALESAGQNLNVALENCREVSEAQGICIRAAMNYDDQSFYTAKDNCE